MLKLCTEKDYTFSRVNVEMVLLYKGQEGIKQNVLFFVFAFTTKLTT